MILDSPELMDETRAFALTFCEVSISFDLLI